MLKKIFRFILKQKHYISSDSYISFLKSKGAGSMEAEAAPSFWGKYKFLVIAGAVAAAGIAAAVVIRIRKKRKAAREEDVDDEIS